MVREIDSSLEPPNSDTSILVFVQDGRPAESVEHRSATRGDTNPNLIRDLSRGFFFTPDEIRQLEQAGGNLSVRDIQQLMDPQARQTFRNAQVSLLAERIMASRLHGPNASDAFQNAITLLEQARGRGNIFANTEISSLTIPVRPNAEGVNVLGPDSLNVPLTIGSLQNFLTNGFDRAEPAMQVHIANSLRSLGLISNQQQGEMLARVVGNLQAPPEAVLAALGDPSRVNIEVYQAMRASLARLATQGSDMRSRALAAGITYALNVNDQLPNHAREVLRVMGQFSRNQAPGQNGDLANQIGTYLAMRAGMDANPRAALEAGLSLAARSSNLHSSIRQDLMGHLLRFTERQANAADLNHFYNFLPINERSQIEYLHRAAQLLNFEPGNTLDANRARDLNILMTMLPTVDLASGGNLANSLTNLIRHTPAQHEELRILAIDTMARLNMQSQLAFLETLTNTEHPQRVRDAALRAIHNLRIRR